MIGEPEWPKIHTDPWNGEQMRACIKACIEQPNAELLVLEKARRIVGAFGIIAIHTPCAGISIAVKVFWFVSDAGAGHGIKLLRVAEEWARGYGVKAIHVDAPSIGVERVLSRYGYDLKERIYAKALNHV